VPKGLITFLFFFALVGATDSAVAQSGSIQCQPSSPAVPDIRRVSRTDFVGDVTLACSGGDPNTVQFISLSVSLNANITSDITGPGADETEALLLIDDPQPGATNTSNGMQYTGQVKGTPGVVPGFGGGPGAPGSGNVYQGMRTGNGLSWSGIPFVPAPAGSLRILRLTNIRVEATQFLNTPADVLMSLSTSGSLFLPATRLRVGRVLPSAVFSVVANAGLVELHFKEVFSTAFKKRITNTPRVAQSVKPQSTPGAFYPTESGFTPEFGGLARGSIGVADTGTRFVVRLSNLPDGVFLVVPNSVVSVLPDQSLSTIIMQRVLNFQQNYSGGGLVDPEALEQEVPIVGGATTLVYEVAALPPYGGITGAEAIDEFVLPLGLAFAQPTSLDGASVVIGYAPIDSTSTMNATAPEPRFLEVAAGGAPPLPAAPTLPYRTFRYVSGDPAPIIENFRLPLGGAVVSDTIGTETSGAIKWLSARGAEPYTTSTIVITVDPALLAPGTYNGAITFRFEASTDLLNILPVLLTVIPPPELLVDVSPLTFDAVVEPATVEPKIVYLTAKNKAVDFTVSVSTTSGASWLAVAPTSGATPKNLSISVDPAGLAPGTYEGALTIAASRATNTPQVIPVTLTVPPPTPPFTTASVVNAASFRTGAVAPGEMVTLFGARIGPAQAATAVLDQNGRVATMLADTRILFDGVPAPLISVSQTQSSCVVPYSVAGKTTTALEVEFEGGRSQPVILAVAPARPGIFTAKSTGSGQGAILNQDGTPNSTANPARAGSVVVLFATGEGQTSPPGVDGKLSDPNALARPVLPVSARIGGVNAVVEYAGGAPGLVAGVLQMNVRVPPNVTPGPAVAVEITVGGVPSSPGVTLAVQ
jgi:uncharacterized protein (TIGR03437 family)